MELEPHALLRINAHEEIFLPVEVRVEWLSKQAALRMRASAMVGSRISQLDDAIRARALLSIVQPPPATPAAGSQTPETASAHGASSSAAFKDEQAGAPRRESEGCVTVGRGQQQQQRVRRGSSEPPLDARDLEVLARMAVAKIKIVLFQLASSEEKKERLQQGKDVFDVYEGLLTSEDLEQAAKEGFPTLDVDSLLHPKHFRYRSLIAARHRYLLRKLAVLLDMEEGGVDSLLGQAADTEKLRDSLADVDLSLDDEAQEGRDAEQSSSPPQELDPRQQKEENARSRSSSSSQSAAASALMSSSGSGAAATTAAVAAAAVAGAVGKSNSLKMASTLRRTSWEKDAGSEDTTEGETDEETMTPHAAHRRDVSEISPSH